MKIHQWPDYTANEGETRPSRCACLKIRARAVELIRQRYTRFEEEKRLRFAPFSISQRLMNDIFPILLKESTPPDFPPDELPRLSRRVFQAAESAFLAICRMNHLRKPTSLHLPAVMAQAA